MTAADIPRRALLQDRLAGDWEPVVVSPKATRIGSHSSEDEPVGSALVGPLSAAFAAGAIEYQLLDADPAANFSTRVVSPCPPWKRAIDVIGAAVGLVALLPLLALIAIWIKCVSRGTVLFCQQRYGAAGRPFTLWKFRTIATNETADRHRTHVSQLMESGRPLAKLDEHLAIIRGGRLLRAAGIDELPQLWNVLRGEMSLVGPRPDVVPYGKYEPWQRRRFDVLPGITGLWQVCGKNHTTFEEMIKLDIEYAERRSALFDLRILLKTVPAILQG
jgi:lipopolysaccharide/colanic/teichoic acid biosynthesis glycosyltransferase